MATVVFSRPNAPVFLKENNPCSFASARPYCVQFSEGVRTSWSGVKSFFTGARRKKRIKCEGRAVQPKGALCLCVRRHWRRQAIPGLRAHTTPKGHNSKNTIIGMVGVVICLLVGRRDRLLWSSFSTKSSVRYTVVDSCHRDVWPATYATFVGRFQSASGGT